MQGAPPPFLVELMISPTTRLLNIVLQFVDNYLVVLTHLPKSGLTALSYPAKKFVRRSLPLTTLERKRLKVIY